MGKFNNKDELFPFKAAGSIEQTFMILILTELSILLNYEEIQEFTRLDIRLKEY